MASAVKKFVDWPSPTPLLHRTARSSRLVPVFAGLSANRVRLRPPSFAPSLSDAASSRSSPAPAHRGGRRRGARRARVRRRAAYRAVGRRCRRLPPRASAPGSPCRDAPGRPRPAPRPAARWCIARSTPCGRLDALVLMASRFVRTPFEASTPRRGRRAWLSTSSASFFCAQAAHRTCGPRVGASCFAPIGWPRAAARAIAATCRLLRRQARGDRARGGARPRARR